MKTVYIPKGETVHYESLVTESLVVKGCLNVDRSVKAKHISGNGVILAGELSADAICADELEAATIVCKTLLAKRVTASEVFASQSAAVSCCFSAGFVRAGKVAVGLSDIDELHAEEVINLPNKKRGLLGMLFASALRSLWLSLTTKAGKGVPVDADYVQETAAVETPSAETEDVPEIEEASEEPPLDFELQRIIALFKLMRNSGYTLRVIPGTPEANAPVMHFEDHQGIRPAA